MIKWTTEQEAKEAAAKGLIPALEHCIKHHGQNRDCSYEELCEAATVSNGRVKVSDCALCRKFGCGQNCELCPLGPKNCCGEYDVEERSWRFFQADHSRANYQAFAKAAGVMVERLEKELVKAKEDEKAKNKPELRHGDYGVGRHGRPFFLTGNGKSAVAHLSDNTIQKWGENSNNGGRYFSAIKFGNIFDDLKRNAEDLEEFRVDGGSTYFKAELDEDGDIGLFVAAPYFRITEAAEIHQKLGQLIATARRRQEKK